MNENFFEFTFRHLSVDVLISAIIYGLVTSFVDDILMPTIFNLIDRLKFLEPIDKQIQIKKFAKRLIFTLIVLIIIYLISISI